MTDSPSLLNIDQTYNKPKLDNPNQMREKNISTQDLLEEILFDPEEKTY